MSGAVVTLDGLHSKWNLKQKQRTLMFECSPRDVSPLYLNPFQCICQDTSATMQLTCSFTFASHNCLISFHMAICPGLEMFGTLSYQNSGWFEINLQAWLIHIPNTSWFNDNICIPDKKKFSCFYNWHWCRTVDVPSGLRRTNFWCRSLNDRQHLSDGFLFLNLTWYFRPRAEAYLNNCFFPNPIPICALWEV